jgi:hypothetical protein
MAYYKIKIQHKRIDHIYRWFFLEAPSQEEALRKMEETCADPSRIFFHLPETITKVSGEEYFAAISKPRDYT